MATVNSFTLIDGKGNFNNGIEKDLKLDVDNSPLAVVSVIGAQSSGKSTLLNLLFRTKFEVMDATSGRHQTTRGIRVSKYSFQGGRILVVDTEGSDAIERGGHETFARQTALFAMAISRIVIINMMCTDVGRESGGGWPLLRTACEVMQQRFRTPHQVMLLFVLRDKTDSPLEALKRQIMDGMEKIWSKRTRPHASLSELFKIEVVAMSHYLIASERETFIAEVNNLRSWIRSHATSNQSTSVGIPSSSFTTYAKTIWKEVKENKYLDLPSYRIMAAREHCDRIARDQCKTFLENESWLRIKQNVWSGSQAKVQGFGKKVSDLIGTRLSRYDENARFHDRTTRENRRRQLIKELLEIIRPTYDRLVDHLGSKTLKDFRKAALDELKNKGTLEEVKVQNFITQFDNQLKDARIEQANWTPASTQRETLLSAMNLFADGIDTLNAKLDSLKIDRRSTWRAIAEAFSRGFGAVTGAVASVFMSILAAAGVPAAIVPHVKKLFGLSQ